MKGEAVSLSNVVDESVDQEMVRGSPRQECLTTNNGRGCAMFLEDDTLASILSMHVLAKIEKYLFYLLVFFLSLQVRHIFYSFRPQFNEWTSVYLYATDILISTLIFLWLWRIILKRDGVGAKSLKYVLIFLAIFLLIVGFSIVLSSNRALSLYGFLKILEFSLLFLYVAANFSKMFNLARFWPVFIAGATLQAIVAIIQFSRQASLGLKIFAESPLNPDIAGVAKIVVNGQKVIRAYGLTPHPNILAAILMIAIFGLVYLFIKNYQNLGAAKKTFFAALFALLFFALFLTFSRAVTVIGLAALVAWLSWIFFKRKEFKKSVLIIFFSLLVISSLLLAIFHSYVFSRYDLQNIKGSQALDLRVYYDQMALNIIKDTPWWGIGQGNFVWTTSSLGLLENWMYQPAHNIYLLIASETGLFGLATFLLFLFFILISAHRSRADKLIVYSLLFIVYSLLVIGLFDHFLWDLQQGQLIFWLFLGILTNYAFGPYGSTDRAQPSEG